MDGTLVEVRWRNPHIYFVIDVPQANGESKLWEMEAGTIYVLERAGVKREMFEVGDQIRVGGNVSNQFQDKFWLTNVLLPEGRVGAGRTEVLTVANGTPRWTGEVVGGRAQWSTGGLWEPTTEAERIDGGFFKVWSPPGPGGATAIRDPNSRPLNEIATEASLARFAEWDPYAFDDACELPGVPRVNYGPHPHQFIDNGDQILLVPEEFYVTRTFHLNSTVDPATQPLSPLGFSQAVWEDERTLVVTTTRVSFPYINLGGYGQSEHSVMVERFAMSEDEMRMDYHVTINDPVMLTAPYIFSGVWVALGEGMGDGIYDCTPVE